MPLQAPLALQLVALLDDQERVATAPLATLAGEADNDTVGAGVGGGGAAVTITLALWLADPPAPIQVSVNVLLVAVSAPVPALPVTGRLPLQPLLAIQLVALVDDQDNVDPLPLVTEVGLALSDTVGDGGGGGASTATLVVWLAEPPAPSQVSVNVLLVAVSAPIPTLPAVGWLPLQPPLSLIHI